MTEQFHISNGGHSPGSATDQLHEEYDRCQVLFTAQPAIVQRFLEAQASQVAQAFTERALHVRFTLPDRVVSDPNQVSSPIPVPTELREQAVGKFTDRVLGKNIHDSLRARLAELEQSSEPAVAVGTGLIRFAAAMHIIRNMLPAGRSVTYVAAADEEIPSIPVDDGLAPESAITAPTDAIAEEGGADEGRGTLQVPYVPAARRFYLPQWVAFDDDGKMLVNSVVEAEAHVASMQRFLDILFAARSLAPYAIVDEEYQKKRYGMLGQLINQGRALARYQTIEIIRAIQARAAAQSLNRGLSLSLPYFDDQVLRMRTYNFVVIPAGRIMFVPAFVVRAAIEEQAKVAQDTRFSHSTRKHLLAELQTLGEAFESTGD
jgi:hypothetical protein